MKTQCCIAGGGPAGIMLGFLLARSGVDVVVLEKWPDFFRDFRGDTIHPSTMRLLRELGLLDEFLKLPHNETKQVALHFGEESVVVADFTHLNVPCPFLGFIPQWDFLNFLASKAKQYPSFHLLMETEAIGLIEEGGRVVGVRAKEKDGEIEIRADLVIGADGRHSTIREQSKIPVFDSGAPIDVLWFSVPRVDDGTGQSLGYIDKGRMMVLLDRDSYWQCAHIIHKGDLEKIKVRGLEAFRNDIAEVVPLLKSAVVEIKSWDQVKLLSVAVDHLETWHRPGLLCIGDSAHAMSPIGGVGINLAVQDAVAAANVLIPAFGRGVTEKDLAAIQLRREPPARYIQRFQVFAHTHIIEPILQNPSRRSVPLALKFFNWLPVLRRIPAYVIGIGWRSEHIRTDIK